jgi:hypothetical protein
LLYPIIEAASRMRVIAAAVINKNFTRHDKGTLSSLDWESLVRFENHHLTSGAGPVFRVEQLRAPASKNEWMNITVAKRRRQLGEKADLL